MDDLATLGHVRLGEKAKDIKNKGLEGAIPKDLNSITDENEKARQKRAYLPDISPAEAMASADRHRFLKTNEKTIYSGDARARGRGFRV